MSRLLLMRGRLLAGPRRKQPSPFPLMEYWSLVFGDLLRLLVFLLLSCPAAETGRYGFIHFCSPKLLAGLPSVTVSTDLASWRGISIFSYLAAVGSILNGMHGTWMGIGMSTRCNLQSSSPLSIFSLCSAPGFEYQPYGRTQAHIPRHISVGQHGPVAKDDE